MSTFEHRALGVASPSLEAIRERLTSEAHPVWALAESLASWRLHHANALRAAWDEHHLPPAPRAEPLALPEHDGLDAIDLARALLLLHPERFPNLDLSDLEPWRSRTRPEPVARLSYVWGRRWAYQRPESIGLQQLFRSLPDRVLRRLSAFDTRFNDGLITDGEAEASVLVQLSSSGDLGVDVPPVWWRDAGPTLDPTTPVGFALVGPAGSGKRTALAHLKQFWPTRGVNIDNFHGGGSPDPAFKAKPSSSYASIDRNMVCGWSFPWNLEPALVQYALELASDPAAKFHLVISADLETWDALQKNVPEVRALRVVEMRPPSDEQLVPLWLCQRPWLEDATGRATDLSWLLAHLDDAPREIPRASRLRTLFPKRETVGTLIPPALPKAFPRPVPEWSRLTRGAGQRWLPLFPTAAHLEAAVELDGRLDRPPMP